jgi:hypothetical protein
MFSRQWCYKDRRRLKVMFQILQGPLGLLHPLELVLAFQELEER